MDLKELIQAVRDDSKVGRGTCSSIDECFTDEELGKVILEEGLTTSEETVAWFREDEGFYREQEHEARAAGGEEVLEYYYGKESNGSH